MIYWFSDLIGLSVFACSRLTVCALVVGI